MAAASVPADSHQSETMWQCMTVGCRFIHPGAGHRHCCSLCPVTQGARHKRRCRILQQNLARGFAAFPAVSVCTTDGCDRLAGPGFDTCCSLCRRHRRHSHRCESLQQRVPGTQVVATANENVASASMSTAAGNDETAMVQQGTASSSSSSVVLTAWNTHQPVEALMNEPSHPEEGVTSGDFEVDLDTMD